MSRATRAQRDLTNLPNLLTMGRVALVPLLVAAFYLPAPATYWVCLVLFVLASLTDFLDGWLARSRDQVTDFGRFLDPIADKILVAAALVMLAASGRLSGVAVIAAVIILCREFIIAGLREFLAGDDVAVPVSQLAKWKTTVQMVAIGVLLIAPSIPEGLHATEAGEALLWIAAVLTVVTGAGYLRAGIARIFGDGPRS